MSASEDQRRIGRPPGVELDSMLTVRIKADLHDLLIREALQHDKPVSEIVRERLLTSPSISASK